jgi:protein subunit release factor B
MKEKLVSVSLKDCIVKPYRGSGPGGQHRNKKYTAIQIVHPESGAEGRCENFREQLKNKKEAFRRMVQSKKFQIWLKIEVSRKIHNELTIEEKVNKSMKKVKVEVRKNKKWVIEE